MMKLMNRAGRLATAVCVAVLFAGVFAAAVAAKDTPDAPGPRRPRIEGLWVWAPVYISDVTEQDRMLEFCTRHGFNRLLVQAPWAPGTVQPMHPSAQHPDNGTALHPKIQFTEKFARLIAEAAKRNIAVEALDGGPFMGNKSHWAESLATVDAIVAFDQSLPAGARLAGLHWDIEPYIQPDWKIQSRREGIEQDYLQLLTDARKKLADAHSAMTFAVDIPMWYDDKTAPNDNCIVTFNGSQKNFHQHIQDITDYVGIMSYRQHALGKNSTFEKVANELAYAEKIGKFVCPAFETTPIKDTPQITFYGKDAATFDAERNKLESALEGRPGFGGMFIHDYPLVCRILEPDATAAK